MSQNNSEILGNEWIAPSLVESEYPGIILPVNSIASVVDSIFQEDNIFQEDSIDSELIFPEDQIFQEDIIFQEDSIALENSIDSKDSIALQEIDVDPLTGMPNNPMVYARTHIHRGITLKHTSLRINPYNWGQDRFATVTATVKVELDPFVKFVVENKLVDLKIQSTAWGIDGSIFGNRNDHLFNFPYQLITREGYYTFDQIVYRSELNEDHSWLDNRDEIGASISVTSSNRDFPVNKQAWTPIVTGYFY